MMDLIVFLQTTAAGYGVVFTIVDKFLKLVKFTPCMTSISAAELA